MKGKSSRGLLWERVSHKGLASDSGVVLTEQKNQTHVDSGPLAKQELKLYKNLQHRT